MNSEATVLTDDQISQVSGGNAVLQHFAVANLGPAGVSALENTANEIKSNPG